MVSELWWFSDIAILRRIGRKEVTWGARYPCSARLAFALRAFMHWTTDVICIRYMCALDALCENFMDFHLRFFLFSCVLLCDCTDSYC
jgi:hypothetical protein